MTIPDLHAHIHRLNGRTVKLARELGLGKRNAHDTAWLFSRHEIGLVNQERERRRAESKALASCRTNLPEYDRKRQRESAARWKGDWRRGVLVELKSIEIALLELSQRVHALSALVQADAVAPWNRGVRYAAETECRS